MSMCSRRSQIAPSPLATYRSGGCSRSGSSTDRSVETATESRLPDRPGSTSGQSSSHSTARGTGAPRRAMRIFSRSRALRDCQARSGIGCAVAPDPEPAEGPHRHLGRLGLDRTGRRRLGGQRPRTEIAAGALDLLGARRPSAPGPQQGQAGAGQRDRAAQRLPHRLGLAQQPALLRRVVGAGGPQLQRLGHAGAVAPLAGRAGGRVGVGLASSRSPRRSASQPAASSASVWARLAPLASARRTSRSAAVGVVDGDHAGQAAQRRHQTLHVAGRLGQRHRLLVRGPGQRDVALVGVDRAEAAQRVARHPRAEALLHLERGAEVARGVLQPSEPSQRLGPVLQRHAPAARRSRPGRPA